MEDTECDKFDKEAFFKTPMSEKPWYGVWTEMVIEQTLNQFFGTDLKQGRSIRFFLFCGYQSEFCCTLPVSDLSCILRHGIS